ncbi:MAG: putative toxin-antitoxin system toxin component, PIN family [Anaerolineae bacterium]|nr:putative toxin-antitoxin system toxin component, PIN family [Anaerolineae bacterium]
MADELKLVLDTQVFLRALINPKSAAGALFADWSHIFMLVTCDQIDAEILDVLQRPKIRAKFPQITDSLIEQTRKLLLLADRVVVNENDIDAICRDPKDDIFLACAKRSQANYLVSEDKDLLVLERHHTTRILNIIEMLTILRESNRAE